jgi:hypothetical protein
MGAIPSEVKNVVKKYGVIIVVLSEVSIILRKGVYMDF